MRERCNGEAARKRGSYFKYLGSATQEKGSTARVEWVETRGDLGQKDSSKREKGKFIRR